MSVGFRIQTLRKEKDLSQEALADICRVSRQTVSKWELDVHYPETDKLIQLSELFGVSVDYLLTGKEKETVQPNDNCKRPSFYRWHYEYQSTKKIGHIPLVHINIGSGFYRAKGIISIGMISSGLLSIGFISMGILSFGILSLGLLAFGVFALGFLAVASIAIGVIAIGAIAIGAFAIGGCAIGLFSCGGMSIAKYVAVGDHAIGMIAIGKTRVSGTYLFLQPYSIEEIKRVMDEVVPTVFSWFKKWIQLLI